MMMLESVTMLHLTIVREKMATEIEKQKHIKNLKTPKKAREEFLVEKEHGKVVIPSDISFGEVLDQLLEDKSKKREKTTVYNYSNIVENHLKPVLGDIPIQEITVDDLEDYFYFKARKQLDEAKMNTNCLLCSILR